MEKRSLSGLWDYRPEDTESFTALPVPGSAPQEGLSEWKYDLPLTAAETEKHLELLFEGLFRRTELFFNGQLIARHESYQAPLRADITGLARPGENQLLLRIDSRRDPAAPPNGALFDLIPLRLAGICGVPQLVISEGCFIRSVYTPIAPDKGEALLIFSAHSDLASPADAELSVALGENRLSHCFTLSPGESETVLRIPLDGLRLWSPEDPFLYSITASLTVRDVCDTFRGRVGFKHLECRGETFYLNGKPYYLLGYGDDFVHPGGLADIHDPDYCRRALRRAKEYGFNHARHHSHLPFTAFLDAADEVGILIQPELALANIPREKLNDENKLPFLAAWRAIIREFRHHPSIGMWCGGNEMEWGFPFDGELYGMAKALDPYRPVTATDGNFMACDVTDAQDFASVCPAEYTDYLPFGELSDMFLRDVSGKPQIVHEMGNYTTLPDIDLLPQYPDPVLVPKGHLRLQDSLTPARLSLYREALDASRALQKLCHKLNIEKARLSPHFAGYHVWTITDYYGTTQGLLDPFYGDKAFTAEEFSSFNHQELLLWDTDRVTFSSGEEIGLRIVLSRFGSDAPLSGELVLTLSDGQHFSDAISVSGYGVLNLICRRISLPAVTEPQELTLTARLGSLSNSWHLYIYPELSINRDREIYINYLLRHLFDGAVPVRHFTIPQPIGPEQLIVTEHLYGGMLEAVERGTNLLFFAGADTFRETVCRNSFKSPWWETGEIWYLNHTNNSQACGIVGDHPALRPLPYRGSWRLDLFSAVEYAPAVDIDQLGLDVDAPLFGVGPELSRRAYLFEFSCGAGRVLVCTLNHSRRDTEDPAIRYLLRRLINYAMSEEFRPRTALTREQFQALLKK